MRYLLSLLIINILVFANVDSIMPEPIFSDEEKAYLKEKKEITMCIDPDWMPFEKIENAKHIGMTEEHFRLFSKKINTPIVLIPTATWTQSIEFAKARKCDIFSLAMSTPERLGYMNFTKPYLTSELVIITQITKPFLDDPRSLTKQPLGITKDYAFIQILKMKYPNSNLIEFNTLKDGLEAVRRGEIFGYVDNLITSGYAIQKDYIGELKIAGKFDEQWNWGIGVRNDDLVLLSIFNKAISSIKNEQYREIINKWISVQYESGFDYELFFELMAFLLFITSLLAYRHYTLNKYTKILEEKERQLRTLSITDSLSGLYNRRHFDDIFFQEFNRAKRTELPFIYAMLDIDNFKKYNDIYGHQLGDIAISLVSDVLQHHTRRAGDYAFRIGGEEFALIFQSTQEQEDINQKKFENILQDIKNLRISHKVNHPSLLLTISCGATKILSYHNIDTLELYRFTDANLYEAKEKGRDRVVYKEIK
ncbi:diguanylate cyclase [Sulfurimonas sp.]|uniref:diguanylate cyclase n=1 Tax=Sulfurimonas sp. TaxID=2022749 RepID=UPI0039E22615